MQGIESIHSLFNEVKHFPQNRKISREFQEISGGFPAKANWHFTISIPKDLKNL